LCSFEHQLCSNVKASSLTPYPLPVGITVVEEGLEVILQPLVVIILDILAEGLYKLFLVNNSYCPLAFRR